jgi:hypothetical protein
VAILDLHDEYTAEDALTVRAVNVSGQTLSITLCPATLLQQQQDGSWSPPAPDVPLCTDHSTRIMMPMETIEERYVLPPVLSFGTYRIVMSPVPPTLLPILNYEAWFSTPSFVVRPNPAVN